VSPVGETCFGPPTDPHASPGAPSGGVDGGLFSMEGSLPFGNTPGGGGGAGDPFAVAVALPSRRPDHGPPGDPGPPSHAPGSQCGPQIYIAENNLGCRNVASRVFKQKGVNHIFGRISDGVADTSTGRQRVVAKASRAHQNSQLVSISMV